MQKDRLLSAKIAYIVFGLIGFCFLFFVLTERELAGNGNIVWTWKFAVSVLGISLAFGGLFGSLVCFLLLGESRKLSLIRERTSSLWLAQKVSGRETGKVFLVSVLFIMLCWLPVYLAYYPAICAYDSPIQTGQAVEGYMIDHHPIAHTLLIKGAIWLGQNLLGSINAGIGVYTLLQQLFLASSFALGIAFLWRQECRRIWLLLLQLFCMLYPFHLYMSVSMTKDTVFSGFFLLQILSFSRLISGENEDKKSLPMGLLFFFSTVGMILFRTNGRYAFLVLLMFLLAAVLLGKVQRRFFGRLFLWALGAFLVGNVLLAVLFEVTDAEQGDRREMLSMPIQQLARVMVYHGGVNVLPEDDDTMDAADRALINDFLLDEAYRYYDPGFADPVKRHTNTYVVRYRPGDFFKTYFHLFIQYPGDYINAALAVNAGYLSPQDVTHAYVNVTDHLTNMGYVQTRWEEETLNSRGIYKDSKWWGLFQLMEQWAQDNAYLKLPVLKYLFVPGTWFYLYLLLFGWLLIRCRFRLCLPFALVGGYYLTLFLGPTVQLRYIYPVMITFPFLVLMDSVRCGGELRDGSALQ